MDLKDFRQHAHQLVDWIADYLEDIEKTRIVTEVKPGEVRAQLPHHPPQQGEPFAAIWQDFQSLIFPGMTHWNHPGWFAYFPANHSPPSLLAEMVTAALGAQCMSWQTSPAATELEQVVMAWLQEMLGLPSNFVGCIQDTASSSTLVALLSAREVATQHQFGRQGSSAPEATKMRVYASKEAHSSIDKAVKLAGFGLDHLRKIPTDKDFAMDVEALKAAIERDLAQGLHPTCVVASLGTTSSSAIDPLEAIGKICKQHGIWLHVDAAYAGAAAILPEHQGMLQGIEDADSFVFNPHKWLLTNFDCSAYYVRDVHALLATFQSSPEYLKTAYDPQVVNFRDWGIPLGRRFRALKLWFVLRSYGVEGLQAILRHHIALAQDFAQRLDAHPTLERMAPAPFGLVCFRHRPEGWGPDAPRLDLHNQTLLQQLNQDGHQYLTHTRLDGRFVIRVSIGQRETQQAHIDHLWQTILDALPNLP
ncbi:MAG: aminotransferase class V-fold PLP-dependent enzyme [Myxococcales bacterium]|nr:aminotransferase class V-fold PLP-dependent enzyme [Myxococcales bacterium]MCB9643353.1 aminotransferase class V-fold PLP-dependent enzyme [Myxococcales bacterium]